MTALNKLIFFEFSNITVFKEPLKSIVGEKDIYRNKINMNTNRNREQL